MVQLNRLVQMHGAGETGGRSMGTCGGVGCTKAGGVTCSRSRLGFGPLFLYPDARSLSSLGSKADGRRKANTGDI